MELEQELEGLLHVSELADHKVENPRDVVKVGEEVEVKILRVDTEERKIGLSLKRAQWAAEEGGDADAMEVARRRGGLEGQTGPLITSGIIETVRHEPGEFNFFRERREKGAKAAFHEKDEIRDQVQE